MDSIKPHYAYLEHLSAKYICTVAYKSLEAEKSNVCLNNIYIVLIDTQYVTVSMFSDIYSHVFCYTI